MSGDRWFGRLDIFIGKGIMENLAMITGASGGLGRATAESLTKDGWSLVLVGRDKTRLDGIADDKALLVEADVSTPEGATAALQACQEERGAVPRALAHCAGNVVLYPLHRMTAEQYRDCLRANLDSAFFTLSAYVAALVKARQPGAAVLVSSVAARTGVARHEAIAAAKGGVEGLVRATAASYAARNIRVNAIAPGLMRTGATERFIGDEKMQAQLAAQYPLGRYGQPTDGAAAIAWLLSEAASWITGQILAVDGGYGKLKPMMRM